MGDDKHIKNPIEVIKKKLWRLCKCGTGWFLIGLLLFAVGIVLLVLFTEYWNTDRWERGLAYAGVGLLIIGLIITTVGIVFCVALGVVYRKREASSVRMFVPPKYSYGEAPYPQQNWGDAKNPHGPPTDGGAHPAASPTAPPAGMVAPEQIQIDDTKGV